MGFKILLKSWRWRLNMLDRWVVMEYTIFATQLSFSDASYLHLAIFPTTLGFESQTQMFKWIAQCIGWMCSQYWSRSANERAGRTSIRWADVSALTQMQLTSFQGQIKITIKSKWIALTINLNTSIITIGHTIVIRFKWNTFLKRVFRINFPMLQCIVACSNVK